VTVSGVVGQVEDFTDCERRDSGWIDQDVNAWTSLGYVAVGLFLLGEVWRSRLPRSMAAFGATLVLEGVGSWLYHAEVTDLSQALHDVPLAAMVAFIAGWHVGRLFDRAGGCAVGALVAGGALGAGLALADAAAVNGIVAAGVVVTVASEVVARRRRLEAVWTLPLLVIAGVALVIWFFGTSSSPACDADSWFQPHGAWHVLTAIVALVWVDRAVAATSPDEAPRLVRRGTDRVIGVLAVVLVRVFHRSVDVRGRSKLPTDRPVLIVANHGNGFVDPIVVAAALGRLPRFLAKAALWKVVVARPFLALAGVLPVHRSSDGDRSSANRSAFEACERNLALGAMVAIFPEGTTGDRAGLDRVRSGAARIALGALPSAPDLVIMPIGLAFESKVETRSRTVVMFGDPIRVADHVDRPYVDDTVEPDRADVTNLTETIAAALEAVSPEFASVDEREMLRAAARIDRDDAATSGVARFGDIESVARRLATTDDAARGDVLERYRHYATRLTLVGLDDRQVTRLHVPWPRLLLSAFAIFVAGPLLFTVTLIFVPALVVVVVGTSLVQSTATKGTVRFLLGLMTGLLTLVVAGIVLADGAASLLAAGAVAIGGVAALVVWPPVVRAGASIHGRLTARDRGSLMGAVRGDRQAVIEAVRARTDGAGRTQSGS
jgi:1-acyl-sn-glycerol-3-phosphate acyltransferase